MESSGGSVVYISYGLPKSASSFVFQLASAIGIRLANRTGRLSLDLAQVAPDLGASGRRDIYAEWIMDARGVPRSAEGLDAAIAEVEAALTVGPPRVAVVKTHAPCSPRLAARIAAGDVLASATFRHPADLVLSRLDMAARDEQPIDHDVLEGYRRTHIPAFLTWHGTPGVAAFEYGDVALQPYAVARRIADQLGLDEDVHDLVDTLISHPDRIAQFNKGVVDRRYQELGTDEIARIEAAVPELMSVLDRHQPIYADPTFAIVVPSLNSAATIDESLQSVIAQRGDFRLRLHVQDGGSTDGTVDHLARWVRLLAGDAPFATDRLEFSYASAPDTGMYDALQRGFEQITGDVYAWLGSDDVFLPGAFQTVASLLRCDPRIDWVTGAQAMTREDGVPFDLDRRNGAVLHPNREMIAAGLADGISAPFLQQEGTFWTDRLWSSVERSLRTDLRFAGDFELWTRMARFAEPVVTTYPLGSYRRRPGQLSGDMGAYHREADQVRARLPAPAPGAPAPDPTSALRVASVRWPEGMWRITHVTPRRIRTDPPTVPAPGPTAGAAPAGWRVLGSDVLLEGPFPELGIRKPFVWVTGRERVLRLSLDEPGDYRVTLVLGNVHPEQEIRCSGPGFSVSRRAPNTSAQTRPFTVRFQTTLDSPHLEIDLACSRSGSLAEDPRDLAVMLLGVRVEPAQRRGLRRGRRELSPSAAV